MQIRFVAATAMGAALVFTPLTRAAETATTPYASTTSAICPDVPRDQFRPESQLRSVVENFLRTRITHLGIDGGCYSVQALDRNGTPFEVRFRGDDLRMVSRYAVKGDATVNTLASNQ